jgi:hypothetical protein
MTPKITHPTQYKHCTIAPVGKKGFDVFEASGRWFNVKTQKQAKWWASIHSRLIDEFNAPKPVPTPVEDHTPTPKGKP